MLGPRGVTARTDPATEAVETTMFRALAALRVVVLVNAVALAIYQWDTFARPGLGAAVLAVMALWTGVAIWAYDKPSLRGWPLMVADLAVTVATVLATPLVKGAGAESTVPGFWVMGVVLAWGIRAHWVGGLIASTAVSLSDIAVRADLSQTNYGNIFLLMIGGPVLGYTSGLAQGDGRCSGSRRAGGGGSRGACPAGAGSPRRRTPGAGARAAAWAGDGGRGRRARSTRG